MSLAEQILDKERGRLRFTMSITLINFEISDVKVAENEGGRRDLLKSRLNACCTFVQLASRWSGWNLLNVIILC